MLAGCVAFGSVGCRALDAASEASDFAKAAYSGERYFCLVVRSFSLPPCIRTVLSRGS